MANSSKKGSFNLTQIVLPMLLIVLGLSTFFVISKPVVTNTQATYNTADYGFSTVSFTCSDGFEGLINDNTCQSKDTLMMEMKKTCADRGICKGNNLDCQNPTVKETNFGGICSL